MIFSPPLIFCWFFTASQRIKKPINPRKAHIYGLFFNSQFIFLKKIVEKVLKKDFSKDSKDNKKNENELEIEYKEEEENLHEEREYISETMYISELFEHSDRKLLSLSEKDNINISTYPFIIGKLSTRADYIFKDNLISRMHLKIIKEEGNYYIEDMNSKNGTFINDIRLIPYKKEKVDIGDKIRIAKYDYIFRWNLLTMCFELKGKIHENKQKKVIYICNYFGKYFNRIFYYWE